MINTISQAVSVTVTFPCDFKKKRYIQMGNDGNIASAE
jgi:hypothetical protein